ncbi:MAG: thiamine biosynthesis protein ApbE [Kordia sp.]|nr:MAG: thiamine biosynthesis protein ApbE [Kordia sp.]
MKRIIIFSFLLYNLNSYSQETYKKSLILMGCDFTITVNANSKEVGGIYIQEAINEITRIEKLISSWDYNSQTTLINQNAGIQPVKVDDELIALIERCNAIAKLTDGDFDISFASMDKIWKFDGSVIEMPSEEKIKTSVAKVGYKNIILNKQNSTVFLKNKGMKIGFGGIGKGYAADKAKALLMNKGVKGGIINASGDLTTWGKQPNDDAWKVGIKNPLNKYKIFAWFPVENRAVVTSGNYEKFVMINGKRYTHIINPKTGYPSQGVISVSVFAPKAELADALATSIFVMGKEKGLHFVNQIGTVDCIIVTDNGKIHYSNNIKNEVK